MKLLQSGAYVCVCWGREEKQEQEQKQAPKQREKINRYLARIGGLACTYAHVNGIVSSCDEMRTEDEKKKKHFT